MISDLSNSFSDLVGTLGTDDVLLAAAQLFEQIRHGKSLEEDFQNLRKFAQIEAKLKHYGHNPTVHKMIAKQFWELHGGWSEDSVKKRVLRQLALPRWRLLVEHYYFLSCLNEGTIDEVHHMFSILLGQIYVNSTILNQYETFERVLKRAAEIDPEHYSTTRYADVRGTYGEADRRFDVIPDP